MCGKRRKLQDWVDLLVGKTFNWLTVLSIEPQYIDGKKHGYLAVCKCKCGAIKKVSPDSLIKGTSYSCGCYRLSKDIIEKQHAWQSDPDKFEKSKQKNRQFYIDHPEMISYLSEKNKEYCAANPDIVKSRADNHRQYYKDHPECALLISEKRKQHFINNPEAHKILSDAQVKYFVEHPDDVAQRATKYLEWYNNNPDAVADMHEKQHEWLNDSSKLSKAIEKRKNTLSNDPTIQKNITKKFKIWAKDNHKKLVEASIKRDALFRLRRKKSDFTELLKIIHSDFITQLLDGTLRTTDVIKTKCPKCGNYDIHYLHNVFVFCRDSIKYGSPPLCSLCRNSLTSSKPEQEIADYISTFYSGGLIRNDRSVLNNKELDLYYPEKKIAIEFNGSYWHNSNHKSRGYHYNKFKSCIDHNILLISIFDHEWDSRKEEIKRYIYDTFNGKTNSISFVSNSVMNNNYPARNCMGLLGDYIEDSYVYNDAVVYTCGHSVILASTIG